MRDKAMHKIIIATLVGVAAITGGATWLASVTAPQGTLPNPSLHPGATNPNVTQANIQQTICKSGYTATIRPPQAYTENLKRKQIKGEKLSGTLADYEEDHLIPLELGGNPTDPKNLWPEPWESKGAKLAPAGFGAETKDTVEYKTRQLVCAGKMTLADAQKKIAKDWHALYVSEGKPTARSGQDDDDT